MNHRRRILVTGATGFLGTALCRALRRDHPEAEVRALVRSDEAARRVEAQGMVAVRGDLREPATWVDALEDCQVVYHLGANASFEGGGDYEAVNVEATRALVDALEGSESLERLVFTSTIGAVDRAPSDSCDHPLDEDSEAFPTSEYGRSKLRAEELIAASDLPWTIVRPSWIYGPGMRRESHIAKLLADARRGSLASRVDLPGRVSVVFVDDLVRALLALPEHAGTRCRIYFADDGEPRALGEVFRLGHELAGSRRRPWALPGPLVGMLRWMRARLPFKVGCVVADVLTCRGTLFEDLGLEPEVAFEDGIQRTWEDLFEQPEGLHVVTGAASGIGLALARELDRRSKQLLLVDRSEALEELAGELGQEWLRLDLARPEAAQELHAHLLERGHAVEGLVNCAGLGHRGDLVEHSDEQVRVMTQVNFVTPVQLCRILLPAMTRRGRGYVMNIASSVAEVPLPGMSVYAATKAALLSQGLALWGELRGSGVRVLTVLPAGTRTGFQRRAGVKVLDDGRGPMPPEVVAATALAALEGSAPVCTIGWKSRLLVGLGKLLPTRLEVLLWKVLMKGLR